MCRRLLLLAGVGAACAGPALIDAPPARAGIVGKILNTGCTVFGDVGEGWWGPACKGVVKVAGKATGVAGKLTGLAGKAKKLAPAVGGAAVGASVLDQLTGWVGTGAVWLLHRVGGLMSSATSPNLQGSFFQKQYGSMALLATLLALPMLFLGVIEATLRRDGAILGASLRAVPAAFIVMGLAAALVSIGLSLTDALSHSLAASASAPVKHFFDSAALTLVAIGASMGIAAHFLGAHAPALAHALAAPGFMVFGAAILAVLAAGAVFLEFLLREVAIYVSVLFVPLVLVARIWPRLETWARHLAQGLVAIILSKFVIVAVLSLAGAGLGAGRLGDLLIACTLLLLAAFTPVVLFRLVTFAEHSFHSRGGSGGTLVRSASSINAAEGMRRTFMSHNAAHSVTRGGAGGGGEQAPAGEQQPRPSVADRAEAMQQAAGEQGGGTESVGQGRSMPTSGQDGARTPARSASGASAPAGDLAPPAPGAATRAPAPGFGQGALAGGLVNPSSSPSARPDGRQAGFEEVGWVEPSPPERPGSGMKGGEA